MKASAQRPVRLRPALAVLLPVLAALAWLAVAAAAAAPAPAAAQGEGARAGAAHTVGSQAAAAPADPVVAQVVDMLRARIGEPGIVLWLDKTGSRPRAVGSADLIALHQAGASDGLLQRLVELAAPAVAAPGGAPPVAGTAPTPVPAPAPAPAPVPAQAPMATPAVAPTPGSAGAPAPAPVSGSAGAPPPASGTAVKVLFAVTYRPVSVEQEDPWAEGWTLFLYLDGRFLATVKRGPLPVPLPPTSFERQLLPGKHLLRLAQERRLRYSSVRGYLSPSRVDPSGLPFELGPGAPAQVEIRFGERSLRHPGPVAMRVEQDRKEISRLEPAGANPERWPALCEDVAASLPAGPQPPPPAGPRPPRLPPRGRLPCRLRPVLQTRE